MEAAAQPAGPQDRKRGFLESLMDTRFESLITPKLVRFIYVVSMIVLAVGVLVAVVASFVDDVGSGILALIFAPLVALIYLIVIRLWLELIIVTFKIRDAADRIADNTG